MLRIQALAAIIVAVCSLLMLSGCVSYGGSEDDCFGVTCSDYGTCALVDGAPICTCDLGWARDPTDPESCVETNTDPILVDLVTAVSDPVDQVVSASLKNHPAVTVTLGTARADLWRDMLVHCMESESPIYMELDPALLPGDRQIIELRHTYVSPVHALSPQDDAVEVQLIWSAAIHFLYRTRPGFDAMLALLEASLEDGSNVVVTERDYDGIIDVRPDNF